MLKPQRAVDGALAAGWRCAYAQRGRGELASCTICISGHSKFAFDFVGDSRVLATGNRAKRAAV
jgi:hypothetical protein